MDKFKIGQRVAVIEAPDRNCDHDIVWGVGTVVGAGFRVEVRFDNGNGGLFDKSLIYPELDPERPSWRTVSGHLRSHGWSVWYKPHSGLPVYLWRSPSGESGEHYRSNHFDAPPDAVMMAAAQAGLVGFTQIAAP